MQSKESLLSILEGMKETTIFLRDEQTVIPCAEDPDTGELRYDPDEDICKYFDSIADSIDDIIKYIEIVH